MIDTFKEDIILGEEIEHKLLKTIKTKYPKAYKVEGEFKDYDLFVPEKNIKIEVKRDIGSNKSDNYFIECFCNGIASGIFATKADYWVIFDENKYIWISRFMLWYTATNKGKLWKGTPKGGCSEVVAYLVPKKEVINIATLITIPHES